jgi:hypothetical protein
LRQESVLIPLPSSHWQLTVGLTAVTVYSVAIVALLTRIKDTVAADGQLTVGLTAITVYIVAIITLFTVIEDIVTADGQLTVCLTAVTVYSVAIIALLAGQGVGRAVTTCCNRAVRIARC